MSRANLRSVRLGQGILSADSRRQRGGVGRRSDRLALRRADVAAAMMLFNEKFERDASQAALRALACALNCDYKAEVRRAVPAI